MASYIYDGTFEGFLTCVYAHYYSKKAISICSVENYTGSLIDVPVEIITVKEQAIKVYDAIEKKISRSDLRRIYRAFNSSTPDKEKDLLNYIELGFSLGSKISLYHSDPVVKKIEQAQFKVGREIDRMLGLVRFSVLEGGILYSKIEPDNDIIEFIAPHFSNRLKNDPFILHDFFRGKAIIASGGSWYVSVFGENEIEQMPSFCESEKELRLLWKKYFESIAIKERTNPRCQKNMMPKRYWKNLTEML